MSCLFILATAVLRSLPAIAALDGDSFAARRPFDVEATVEAVGPEDTRLVISADGIRTYAMYRNVIPPPPGTRVRIAGQLLRDICDANLLCVTSLVTLGTAPLPEPVRVSASELSKPDLDLRTITVSGTVSDILEDDIDSRWIYIILHQEGINTYLAVPKRRIGTELLSALPQAQVEATGICVQKRYGRRVHFGTHIVLNGGEGMRILRPAAEDDVPSIDPLRRSGLEAIQRSGRRSVCGFVKAVWNGNSFLLAPTNRASSIVRVAAGTVLPTCGDFVSAVGQVETDCYTLNLTGATWRRLDGAPSEPAETPTDVSANEMMSIAGRSEDSFRPQWQGKFCRLRGIIRRLPDEGSVRDTLRLECDGRFLEFTANEGTAPFAGLVCGSTVEISAYCTLVTQHWCPQMPFPQILGYRFVVRRPEDIRLLARPPWWTPGRLLAVIAALVAALAGIVVWNRTLNRLVNRRSRQLLKEQIARERAFLKIGERNRLAIELHDSLSQNLAAIACQVSATRSGLAVRPDETAQNLDTVERMLLSSRTELKRCLQDLRNDALDEPDMTAALEKALSPVAGTARLHVRFNVPRSRLDDTTAHAVICIVRELVSNAVRHGHAANVRVAGDLTDGTLSFSVRDDGCGFAPDSRPDTSTGHFGLDGIRERAERMNAEFTITSSAADGTHARVSVSLPHPDGKDSPA